LKGKSHDHYGPRVQAALLSFQDAWVGYSKSTDFNFKHFNYHRLDALQEKWDELVKARKAETGNGGYLSKEHYTKLRR
jgi:hypothetical protein